MKHFSSLALATVLAASNSYIAQASPLEAEEEREINALCEKYALAYKAKDASAIASLFVERHPLLMPPNMPAAIGREAIKSRYQGFFDNPPPDSIRMERLEVIGDSADWMVDPEKLLILITNSNDNYKHLAVFLRDQNKSWKIAHLIWNSNSR